MTRACVTCPLDNTDVFIELTFSLDDIGHPRLNVNAPELVAHIQEAHLGQ